MRGLRAENRRGVKLSVRMKQLMAQPGRENLIIAPAHVVTRGVRWRGSDPFDPFSHEMCQATYG